MKLAARILKYILVLVVLFFFLFPVYWIVLTAFKPFADWFTSPPTFFELNPTLSNFTGGGGAYTGGGATTAIETIVPYLRNSFVVATAVAIFSTLLAAMAAYAVSRFKTGGINFVGWIISIRMLPPIASVLPLYLLFKYVGDLHTYLIGLNVWWATGVAWLVPPRMLDTWGALILAHLVFTTPFATWILITFFNEIPRELDEAASVDGASPLQSFLTIVLPLAAPGLAAVATLSFIQSWGEFLLALILTSSTASMTLPLYLGRYITGFRVAWGPLAAAGLVTMLPVIVVSLIMQRFLIRGLTFGAMKG